MAALCLELGRVAPHPSLLRIGAARTFPLPTNAGGCYPGRGNIFRGSCELVRRQAYSRLSNTRITDGIRSSNAQTATTHSLRRLRGFYPSVSYVGDFYAILLLTVR